ncbi:hypothetical protein EK21DRAFT_107097 [Setomelanomma holmii]|uniref:BTB domain-containing protein n=1 Tax=Setomelanomma holmii TaxID=210430 RepID=A0A9P4HI05_9PLEO|nr:hypothetical protein EK21DRAFT_107097 [Setomelanomma holmii]
MVDSNQSSTTTTAPRLSAAISGPLVRVKVGLEGRPYLVHKAVLVHQAEYFSKALSESWKGAQNNEVVLEDVEPCIFTSNGCTLVQCPMGTPSDSKPLALHGNPTKFRTLLEHSMAMLKAGILGYRLLAPKFRAATMECFACQDLRPAEYGETVMFCELACHAYKNVPVHGVLLQYLANTWCEEWDHDNDGEDEFTALQQLPHAFLLCVMRRQAELKVEQATPPTWTSDGRSSIQRTERRCYSKNETAQDQADYTSAASEFSFRTHLKYDETLDYGFCE